MVQGMSVGHKWEVSLEMGRLGCTAELCNMSVEPLKILSKEVRC